MELKQYNPIGQFTKDQLYELVKASNGAHWEDFKAEYIELDHLDPENEDFYELWVIIYINLKFAYGVKHGLIDPTSKEPLTHQYNGYSIDIEDIIADQMDPDLYDTTVANFYKEMNIEAYLPFV